MKLRIGIAGTRGVPNRYGGFEQFASCLSKALVRRGHQVTVYNTHNHPYQNNQWNGVNIVHCRNPEYLGATGQFVYDLHCIRDARQKKFDVLLMLGYTSSSVWGRWFPKNTAVITNMDGMEWKRSKYPPAVRWFLQLAERWAMKHSDRFIADSTAIKNYLERKYEIPVEFISYGSITPQAVDENLLSKYRVTSRSYYLLIARMEPENNIEIIIEGLIRRNDGRKILVIANAGNRFGKRLQKKFRNQALVEFAGTEYDRDILDALRAHCYLYFHGHSVGGTNPSLLEAMAAGALICAHDNVFNRSVLGDNACWFVTADDIASLVIDENTRDEMSCCNILKIKTQYDWQRVIDAYENIFIEAHNARV